jgi:hypothetical protein
VGSVCNGSSLQTSKKTTTAAGGSSEKTTIEAGLGALTTCKQESASANEEGRAIYHVIGDRAKLNSAGLIEADDIDSIEDYRNPIPRTGAKRIGQQSNNKGRSRKQVTRHTNKMFTCNTRKQRIL